MKLKIVVIDFEIPPRVKRWGLRIGIPAALLLGGGAMAYATGLPVVWVQGQTLNASDLNANFAAVQTPPGTVVAYAGPVIPSGWLLCDGSAISRSTYANLFSAIGTVSGTGDGATTFNLPDYRGMFLRGVDTGDPSNRDPGAAARTAAASGGNTGDAVGSIESWATGMPISGFSTNTAGAHTHTVGGGAGDFITDVHDPSGWNITNGPYLSPASATDSAGDHSHTLVGGDSETRPRNAYVNYMVKY